MGNDNKAKLVKLDTKINVNDLGILNVLLIENFDIQCEFISHQLYLVLKNKDYSDVSRKIDSIKKYLV